MYFKSGANAFFTKYQRLEESLQLVVDGAAISLAGIQCLVLLNLPSYGAGTNAWGKCSDSKFADSSFSDGTLEVVGMKNVTQLAGMQCHVVNGIRLAQGKKFQITITPGQRLACQVISRFLFLLSNEISLTESHFCKNHAHFKLLPKGKCQF